MNKKFQSIIGCLEIEAIEESDGKFHLSADLMQNWIPISKRWIRKLKN